MKWRDLSITSKCIIEQCWDIYTDKPQEFTMKIDKNFKIWVGINEGYNYYRFTEEVYNEIVKYHKEKEQEGMVVVNWNYKREGNKVTFKGKQMYNLENGKKY